MRTRVFFVLLLMFSASASAQEGAVSHDRWCDAVATLSDSIMSSRQNGVPMRDVMKIVDGIDGGERLQTIARGMVLDAYEMPRFESEKNKKSATVDFQNKWYATCLKAKN